MARLQLNLLPDIKLQANQQQRTRNLIISIAIIVTGICVAILLLLAVTVYGIQKKQLNDSNKKVQQASDQLKAIPNLDKVLTVQKQLSSLTNLHQSKHISSRLFDYLTKVIPSKVSISQISVDFATNTIKLSGTTNSQYTVNVLVDTLKHTQFKMGQNASELNAFTLVTEDSFGFTQDGTAFSISLKFDPLLFANNKTDKDGRVITPILVIPNKTTTRSSLDDPGAALFNGQAGN